MDKFILGNIYHVYNRGVDRQRIFYSERNMTFFLIHLAKYFAKEKVSLYAYCLMPNHYHLLIKITQPEFGRKVMQPLMTSYAKAINRQQNRVGPLFQGSFRTKMMPSYEVTIYASKYIHLNPVKAKLVNHPRDWAYSSYRDYMRRANHSFVNTDFILSYFNNSRDYEAFLFDDKEYSNDSFVFDNWEK